jgi:hypothetical protein
MASTIGDPFRVQHEGGVGALFILDELHTAFSTNSAWLQLLM